MDERQNMRNEFVSFWLNVSTDDILNETETFSSVKSDIGQQSLKSTFGSEEVKTALKPKSVN